MFVQLTALRRNSDGVRFANGNVTVQKEQIAAVAKDSYHTSQTNIYLTSGQVIPVMENIADVEAILMS